MVEQRFNPLTEKDIEILGGGGKLAPANKIAKYLKEAGISESGVLGCQKHQVPLVAKPPGPRQGPDLYCPECKNPDGTLR